ncbi:MAG: hypothetical protein JXA09_10970 [Anaerolineae bacterium]|nr:hypothetical protein [Anaerolineae bacterium]
MTDATILDPGREYSLIPFWFWNDDLSEQELARQIADMERHGVYGFVIHPRVGLPREIGWMSDRMLHYVRFAVEEAACRGMTVILYDEGMYPSGSSSGQVVARNPAHHCRCFAKLDLAPGEQPVLAEGQTLVAVAPRLDGRRIAVIDRPVDAYIRGIHYIGEGPQEDEPPAGDILNPEAVASFVHLVYDRYAQVLEDYLSSTILGIFTDEPGPLGRCRERDVVPGTTGLLEHVSRILGYDFTPHLPALWYDDEPDAARHRAAYREAIDLRLEETFYRPLHDWCTAHGVALCGHPARGDQIGVQRYFHIPGQDLVWRWVLPHQPSALEGPESTQAKCSASAMVHLGRTRNSNECFGAYGHGFTWEEMKWLVDWCFVRGANLLYPHAFFYSIRGPRRDERPPDVGPNSPWWDDYRPFADYCRRLSWLNTAGRHVCRLAILGRSNRLPWSSAKVCFQHQRDFAYLEARHLWQDAAVSAEGVRIRDMHYRALIVDGSVMPPDAVLPALRALAAAGRLIWWSDADVAPAIDGAIHAQAADQLVRAIDALCPVDLTIAPPSADLRYRHVVVDGVHYYLLCNEGAETIRGEVRLAAPGDVSQIDPWTGTQTAIYGAPSAVLPPYTTTLLQVAPGG